MPQNNLVSHNAPLSDPGDLSKVFVTPRHTPILKEGDDFLFRCLLTDPSVTNLTVQSEDKERGLPPGMNVTFDHRRGALIQNLRRAFKGRYTCSGWRNGQEFRSKPVDLQILPSKIPVHMSVHLSVCTTSSSLFLVSLSPCLQGYITPPPCPSLRLKFSVCKESGLKSPVRPVTPPTL